MKYKLLALDIDGTLVGDKESTISSRDMAALAKAARQNIIISLCTGRAPKACRDILDRLSLDGYHAFYDGALVSNPHTGYEIYVQALETKPVQAAIDYARAHQVDLELYSATHYYAERETWSTYAHREFFGVDSTIIDYSQIIGKERIIKGGLVARDKAEAEKVGAFCDAFKKEFFFTWVRTPAYPGTDFINMVATSVSKGKAIAELAAHSGIKMDEVMAIGDGTNDISLLSMAGFGVAMQEAPEKLKAVAGYVTGSVKESGVAAAVEILTLVPYNIAFY